MSLRKDRGWLGVQKMKEIKALAIGNTSLPTAPRAPTNLRIV
jgi:hypothetical protein